MYRIKFALLVLFTCFFIGIFIQIYLVFKLDLIGIKANIFFYAIFFLLFFSTTFWYTKKKMLIVTWHVFVMIVLFCLQIFNKNIEDYYFNKTVLRAEIIKKDLAVYQKRHREFPKDLKILYGKSEIPKYSVGLLKYNFQYSKIDSAYRLYFDFFDGKTFSNYGPYKSWNFYD